MNEIKSSVMKAVHGDLLNKKHRQRNLVISGFKPSSTIGDKDLFKDLYDSHFNLRPIPEPVLCRRLIPRDQNGSRNKNPNRINPLLVFLQTEAQAQYILSNARFLRNSNSEYTKNNVYINRDLTKAEAAAEYEYRQKRREKAKQFQMNKPSDMDSDESPSVEDGSSQINNSNPPVVNVILTVVLPPMSSLSTFPPLSTSGPLSSKGGPICTAPAHSASQAVPPTAPSTKKTEPTPTTSGHQPPTRRGG